MTLNSLSEIIKTKKMDNEVFGFVDLYFINMFCFLCHDIYVDAQTDTRARAHTGRHAHTHANRVMVGVNFNTSSRIKVPVFSSIIEGRSLKSRC